jgi:hypothetical protein
MTLTPEQWARKVILARGTSYTPTSKLAAASLLELLAAAETVRNNNRKGVTGKEARDAWTALNAAILKATGAA